MNGSARIKIALHHGLPLVRAGLDKMVTEQPGLQLQRDWQPDQGLDGLEPDTRVLVLDLAVGLRLAEQMRHEPGLRHCSVMIVTDQAGEWDIRQAVLLGVLGLFLLNSSMDRILGGVQLLARGTRSFDDAVAARIADCLMQPLLTDRERDVLTLIADGACNKEVARHLGIALGTVKGHVRALLDKLDVESRVQAVIVAKQRGLISQPHVPSSLRGRGGSAATGPGLHSAML